VAKVPFVQKKRTLARPIEDELDILHKQSKYEGTVATAFLIL